LGFFDVEKLSPPSLNVCHSERSEESHTFSRTLLINFKKYAALIFS
jgi:hypothetical protein